MSRADYLSKYLSGGGEKKLKKKSKKPNASGTAPVIVATESKSLSQVEPDDQNEQEILNEDPENEYLPVGIELSLAPKQSKGFKRIDNGVVVAPKTLQPVETTELERPETVYRDTAGRIFNIEERRAQLKEEKAKKELEAKEAQERVNTGELSRIQEENRQQQVTKATRFAVSKNDEEYVNHMSNKDRFDDPLAAFGQTSKAQAQETTATGRPVYTQGVNLPNRFKIQAGAFWDGIDRSNGFEDKLLRKRNDNYVTKFTQRASAESYTEYDYE